MAFRPPHPRTMQRQQQCPSHWLLCLPAITACISAKLKVGYGSITGRTKLARTLSRRIHRTGATEAR